MTEKLPDLHRRISTQIPEIATNKNLSQHERTWLERMTMHYSPNANWTDADRRKYETLGEAFLRKR